MSVNSTPPLLRLNSLLATAANGSHENQSLAWAIELATRDGSQAKRDHYEQLETTITTTTTRLMPAALTLDDTSQELSFADWWQHYWSRKPFPSGYTQSSITMLACLITTIIFLIVVGNCLVCIAIFTEKSLKPTQNWFIASLAVSDMLLGLVVMPFSLARELMGFWVFGPLWCDVHEAVDVLLTTASINTLCLISLDRYWSITQAVNYLKKRTPRRGAFMIAFVWVFSAAVSLPPLFGWKKQTASLNAPPQSPENLTEFKPRLDQSNSSGLLDDNANSQADDRQLQGLVDQDQDQVRDQDQDFQQTGGAATNSASDDQTSQAGERQLRHWRRKRRRHAQLDENKRNSMEAAAMASSKQGNVNSLTLPSIGSEPSRRDAAPNRGRRLQQVELQQVELQQQIYYANLLLQQEAAAQLQAPGQIGATLAASNEYPTCQLSDDVGYVLYSAFGSFFIPCGVMVFTYIKIFLAARSRARRAINKQSRALGGATDKAKQRLGASSNNQQQHQRKTIVGATTGGRASKQIGLAPSIVGGVNDDKTLLIARRRSEATADQTHQQQQQQQQRVPGNLIKRPASGGARKQSGVLVSGSKLVVVDRRKSLVAQQAVAKPADELAAQVPEENCATLETSGAEPATAEALEDGKSRANQEPKTNQRSSLITVMSESMTDLPVTRFNFKQETDDDNSNDASKSAQSAPVKSDENRVAALLHAISKASDIVEEKLIGEMLYEDEKKTKPDEAARPGEQSADPPAPVQNNSTNETCFMTIEEDSDNLEAQTGRTIMMVASNARSPLPSAAKSQGITLTMMPIQSTPTTPASPDRNGSSCNNVACLRRQRQRAARSGSSYCGSSTTVNDDDEEEDDEEEEEEDEEEDVDEEDDGVDELDDECLDDELLTDDCNGYSNSCGLDQECGLHCNECAAALAAESKIARASNCLDSPSCHLSTPGDSPRIFAHGHKQQPFQQSVTTIGSSQAEHQFVCANHQHHRHDQHDLTRPAICNRTKQQLTSQQQQLQQQRFNQAQCNDQSNEMNESLTGDDNLSLTDYRSQDEENSSIVGHDMLDATPASPRIHSASGQHKRKSIVASALASVTGANINASSASPDDKTSQSMRKKSSIGFRLSRLGSSAPLPLSEQTGGLLALAAASQQQQLLGASINNHNATTGRNLKTLRQNFFHKLNQLTAKSAMKQQQQQRSKHKSRASNGKSSAQSSYGSSYEPSIDYATTSNVHSNNDHFHQESTFGDVDPYEQQNSGDTKQSQSCVSAEFDTDETRDISRTNGKSNGRPQSNVSCEPGSKLQNLAMATYNKKVDRNFSTSQHQQLQDNLSESIATNKPMPSTTTDDDSMLLHSTGHGASNKSPNNPDLNLKKTSISNNVNNPSNKHLTSDGTMHGVATIVPNYPTSGPVKKRSSDKGTGNQLQQGDRHQHQQTTHGGANKQMGGTGGRPNATGNTNRAYLASDNERHKRKLAKARERRATLILGLIMAAFICSWLPFFTFYVLRALCHVCRDYISPRFEAFIFWMGYCNSAINPIIYTIFNRDFRKAFRKILFKCL